MYGKLTDFDMKLFKLKQGKSRTKTNRLYFSSSALYSRGEREGRRRRKGRWAPSLNPSFIFFSLFPLIHLREKQKKKEECLAAGSANPK